MSLVFSNLDPSSPSRSACSPCICPQVLSNILQHNCASFCYQRIHQILGTNNQSLFISTRFSPILTRVHKIKSPVLKPTQQPIYILFGFGPISKSPCVRFEYKVSIQLISKQPFCSMSHLISLFQQASTTVFKQTEQGTGQRPFGPWIKNL